MSRYKIEINLSEEIRNILDVSDQELEFIHSCLDPIDIEFSYLKGEQKK